MSKRVGIILSLILALVFTLLITVTGHAKYREAAKTVNAVQAAQFIPAGAEIKPEMVATVPVPESMAAGLATDVNEVVGKSSYVSIIKGQYIWKDAVDLGAGRAQGNAEIFIPTDLSSSAAVLAGELVDVYVVIKGAMGENSSVRLYTGLRVLHSLDQNGNEIDPARKKELTQASAAGSKVPVSVGVEAPQDGNMEKLVQAAATKSVYLTKSSVLPQGAR